MASSKLSSQSADEEMNKSELLFEPIFRKLESDIDAQNKKKSNNGIPDNSSKINNEKSKGGTFVTKNNSINVNNKNISASRSRNKLYFADDFCQSLFASENIKFFNKNKIHLLSDNDDNTHIEYKYNDLSNLLIDDKNILNSDKSEPNQIKIKKLMYSALSNQSFKLFIKKDPNKLKKLRKYFQQLLNFNLKERTMKQTASRNSTPNLPKIIVNEENEEKEDNLSAISDFSFDSENEKFNIRKKKLGNINFENLNNLNFENTNKENILINSNLLELINSNIVSLEDIFGKEQEEDNKKEIYIIEPVNVKCAHNTDDCNNIEDDNQNKKANDNISSIYLFPDKGNMKINEKYKINSIFNKKTEFHNEDNEFRDISDDVKDNPYYLKKEKEKNELNKRMKFLFSIDVSYFPPLCENLKNNDIIECIIDRNKYLKIVDKTEEDFENINNYNID